MITEQSKITITTPWNVSVDGVFREGTSDKNTLLSCLRDDEYEVNRLPNKGIAIDLGAHIGAATLALASKGLHVYAVEMLPENINLLNINVALNDFARGGMVKVYHRAITGKDNDEVTALYQEENTEFGKAHHFIGSLIPRQGYGKDFITVKTISLERIFSENKIDRCDVVKVDTEGAEWDVFENTPKEVLGKIDRFAVELESRDGGVTNTDEFLKILGDQFVDVSREYFPKWCDPGRWVHGYYINKRLI